jgi:hypothetical protein
LRFARLASRPHHVTGYLVEINIITSVVVILIVINSDAIRFKYEYETFVEVVDAWGGQEDHERLERELCGSEYEYELRVSPPSFSFAGR